MPATRAATVSRDELPEVANVSELAAFLRVDARTLRAAIAEGAVPGVVRYGRTIRIITASYFAAIDTSGGPQ